MGIKDEINKNLLRSADRLCKNLGYKTLDEIIAETEERIREENERCQYGKEWQDFARKCMALI